MGKKDATPLGWFRDRIPEVKFRKLTAKSRRINLHRS
jgi:hypothetical protein